MFISDLSSVFFWWSLIFLLGSIFFPLTSKLFSNFIDKGFIFSKILGIMLLTYVSWLLGILHLLPLSTPSLLLVIAVFIFGNILFLLQKRGKNKTGTDIINWKLIAFEELLFFAALAFWSYIKAHQPDVIGLEKYMDFGFINSLLRSNYFPPLDLWLAKSPTYDGYFINYYYFGHLATAVLTKISGLNPATTFNLMLSTIFAFTFTCSFSVALNLIHFSQTVKDKFRQAGKSSQVTGIIFSLLTAYIITLGGNLHTIYAFTKSYTPADKSIPVWETFSQKTTTAYWYPNATRFIPYTIHEFPSYSFVVSDLHGHVLDIPFVLFTIALLLSLVLNNKFQAQNPNSAVQNKINSKLKIQSSKQFEIWKLKLENYFDFGNWNLNLLPIITLGLSLAIMYMTNAWDGLIYFGLSILVFFYININKAKSLASYLILNSCFLILLFLLFIAFSLPFQLTFIPFVSGIGVVRDHSAWWMHLTLWGFFYYCAFGFLVYFLKKYRTNKNLLSFIKSIPAHQIFLLLMIILSIGLLFFPEIFYVKDIYPTHYRANTMFKLGYQAFMMLSLVSGYVIYLFFNLLRTYRGVLFKRILLNSYFLILTSLLFLVIIYPYYSVNSYFDGLKNYKGLYGMSYLEKSHPDDYRAILWFNKNVDGQPVILEAVGESYTDYSRFSANTGLPTILGWPVHEWLWRGSYDEAGKRVEEVSKIYTSRNINEVRNLLKKYNVSYAVVGEMEKTKYKALNEQNFFNLGRVVYQSGGTKVYLIN